MDLQARKITMVWLQRATLQLEAALRSDDPELIAAAKACLDEVIEAVEQVMAYESREQVSA